jgi:hypothetical protein
MNFQKKRSLNKQKLKSAASHHRTSRAEHDSTGAHVNQSDIGRCGFDSHSACVIIFSRSFPLCETYHVEGYSY